MCLHDCLTWYLRIIFACRISCLCQSCNGSSFVMTPSMWDKHAASKSKKWKTSIKIKDTETSLNNFVSPQDLHQLRCLVNAHPCKIDIFFFQYLQIENLKPSTRSKKQQVFPAAMLKNKVFTMYLCFLHHTLDPTHLRCVCVYVCVCSSSLDMFL